MTKHAAFPMTPRKPATRHWLIEGRKFSGREVRAMIEARHLQNTTYPRTLYFDGFDDAAGRSLLVVDAAALITALDRFWREASPCEVSHFIWDMLGAVPSHPA